MIQQRVVLIDGPRLARLMIAHRVGVRTAETYLVRSLDEQAFDD
jgi:restriction system protein